MTGLSFDYDNSGFGVLVESTVKMASADAPTTCDMKRPEIANVEGPPSRRPITV